jgi:hypothetical protein
MRIRQSRSKPEHHNLREQAQALGLALLAAATGTASPIAWALAQEQAQQRPLAGSSHCQRDRPPQIRVLSDPRL